MKVSTVLYTIFLGTLSATLYFLLYLFEEKLLIWTAQGGWFFIIPILIAFIFSLVHGAFTSYFWDILNIKAKAVRK